VKEELGMEDKVGAGRVTGAEGGKGDMRREVERKKWEGKDRGARGKKVGRGRIKVGREIQKARWRRGGLFALLREKTAPSLFPEGGTQEAQVVPQEKCGPTRVE